jgi:hypothetical protein
VLGGTPFAAVSVSRRYYEGNLGDIRALGERAGGTWAGGAHFVSGGARSCRLASRLVFMRKNEPRSSYSGVPLPRPNLTAHYAEQAKLYAHELADSLQAAAVS